MGSNPIRATDRAAIDPGRRGAGPGVVVASRVRVLRNLQSQSRRSQRADQRLDVFEEHIDSTSVGLRGEVQVSDIIARLANELDPHDPLVDVRNRWQEAVDY